MEKDIGKISKNMDTDIVIRIDDFGGKVGLTIREFVKGERYTGFTKAGTRIPADKFKEFKGMINSVDENELASAVAAVGATTQASLSSGSSGHGISSHSTSIKKEPKSESKTGKKPKVADIDDMEM